jgi:hypothetical protein
MIIRLSIAVPLLAIAGCSSMGSLSPPTQPTPASIQEVNVQLAALTSDPVTTWQVGDYAVRLACHAWLDAAAVQNARSAQANVGLGVLGAGLSIVNPLAGVAASLGQTLLTSLQAAGPTPSAGAAALVVNALDAYEGAAGTPSSVPAALSWVDDEWYLCSPAGVAHLEMTASITAQVGTVGSALTVPGTSSYFAARAAPLSTRPVVTINGR